MILGTFAEIASQTSGFVCFIICSGCQVLGDCVMRIRIVENFDADFILDPQVKTTLFGLLTSQGFLNQVSQQVNEKAVEFTELLFQPIPYSVQTPKGMPREFEQYHESEDHIIVNVPPNFMFQAKIFQPSRLCAIYRLVES